MSFFYRNIRGLLDKVRLSDPNLHEALLRVDRGILDLNNTIDNIVIMGDDDDDSSTSSGWIDAGGIVHLVTLADKVGIGTDNPVLAGTIHNTRIMQIDAALRIGGVAASFLSDGIIELTNFGYLSSSFWGGNTVLGSNLGAKSSGFGDVLFTPLSNPTRGYRGVRFSVDDTIEFYNFAGATTGGATVTPTARLAITTTGDVGIGLTNPAYNLEVAGDFNAAAVYSNGILLTPGTGSNWTLSGSNVYRTVGTVGIGTTGALARLAINGGVHVGGDSDPGDNNLLVDGTLAVVGAVSFTVPLGLASGGTGQATAIAAFNALSPTTGQGDIIYHDGTNDTRLAKDTNATRYLSNTGVSNNPAWAQVNLTNGVTGVLPAANGGSNWTISGANIYRASGKVGIGSANPTVVDAAGSLIAPDRIYMVEGTAGAPVTDNLYRTPMAYFERFDNSSPGVSAPWCNPVMTPIVLIEGRLTGTGVSALTGIASRVQSFSNSNVQMHGASFLAETHSPVGQANKQCWAINAIASWQDAGNSPINLIGIEVDIINSVADSATNLSDNFTAYWAQTDGTKLATMGLRITNSGAGSGWRWGIYAETSMTEWSAYFKNVYSGGGGIFVGLLDGVLAGTALGKGLVIGAGALGVSITNELAIGNLGFRTGNSVSLGVRAYRAANGTDWNTTAIGLGMDVDNTVRAGASIWLHANSNVGIGTTIPAYKLDIAGSFNATSIYLNGTPLTPGSGSNWTLSGSNIYRLTGRIGFGVDPGVTDSKALNGNDWGVQTNRSFKQNTSEARPYTDIIGNSTPIDDAGNYVGMPAYVTNWSNVEAPALIGGAVPNLGHFANIWQLSDVAESLVTDVGRYRGAAYSAVEGGTTPDAVVGFNPVAVRYRNPVIQAPHAMAGQTLVVSITRSGLTVTVTTRVPHNLRVTVDRVTISGANQTEYNGCWIVRSVTSSTVFTYTLPVGAAPATPATGTLQLVAINHTTVLETNYGNGTGIDWTPTNLTNGGSSDGWGSFFLSGVHVSASGDQPRGRAFFCGYTTRDGANHGKLPFYGLELGWDDADDDVSSGFAQRSLTPTAIITRQWGNGQEGIVAVRYTDTAPTGFLLRCMSANFATNILAVTADGKVGIGIGTPTAALDVFSNIIRLRTAKTPASATAAGDAGDICWDATHVYICIATNTWRRIAHATW